MWMATFSVGSWQGVGGCLDVQGCPRTEGRLPPREPTLSSQRSSERPLRAHAHCVLVMSAVSWRWLTRWLPSYDSREQRIRIHVNGVMAANVDWGHTGPDRESDVIVGAART